MHACLVELLVAFERYRAYVVPGEPAGAETEAVVDAARDLARSRLPEWSQDTLELLRDLVLDRPVTRATPHVEQRRAEFVVRFQQTCGPVMAKGAEDTAFYRWPRLVALNEVGGDPRVVGVPPENFHDYAARIQRDWPLTMTTLSTHDTKRSEDVRARLYALTELTAEWAEAVRSWTEAGGRHRTSDSGPDPATVYLLWQTLVGTWHPDRGPISPARLTAYLRKATCEADLLTSWTQPNAPYDAAVAAFAEAVLADDTLLADVDDFCRQLAGPARVAVLGQKLVQLTMPGIPDVYQGCELVDLSLVDPDNRRPVDFELRRRMLDGAGDAPSLDAEKLLVTTRALRLRAARPEAFVGPEASYTPLATTTGNAVAFARGVGDQPLAVTVATRLPIALERRGGWGEHTVGLPDGSWRDVLTGHDVDGGGCQLAELLGELPIALLARA